jgi:tetratricopeptide (TPR) repeat protein
MIRGLRQVTLLLSAIALLLPIGAQAQIPTQPGDDATGGLARNDDALAALQPLALMPDAINAYNRGLEYRNKAWKLEEQAATADGEKAAKKAAKAQKSYKAAIRQFRIAVEQEPNFHQAFGSLGCALLKTGRYEKALEAYDRALAIGPRYPEAIEERGEAYLGLDRIDEAKDAYMLLLRVNRELAAELMTAMKRWLDERSGDANELSAETIEGFAAWIEERSEPVASTRGGRKAYDRSMRARERTALAIALMGFTALGCVATVHSTPGKGQGKVVLCHKGKKTMEVAEPAADAHLRHGDTLGPCR